MLVYNVSVAVLLLAARFGSGIGGGALMAAVLLHAGMAAWCVACVGSNRG
jgi:ribosomal protein S5